MIISETLVDIGESVRGRDVYILQTGTKYVSTFRSRKLLLLFFLFDHFHICLNIFSHC